jgi:DnaA family protein
VCLDDLQVIAGKGLGRGAVPSVQPPARQWPTAADCRFDSPRELPIKLADLKSRLTLALIFQMRRCPTKTNCVPCNCARGAACT